MRKPRRKEVKLRMPREVAEGIRRIAKRAGTTQTNVINVMLAAMHEHINREIRQRLDRAAPVPDPVRRTPTR